MVERTHQSPCDTCSVMPSESFFTDVKPKLGLEIVWLAPGVGPVKIEGAEGSAVLIDYEIKAVASPQ